MTAPASAFDTAHAGAMDRMYRYQRHIYDITRKYYLIGRDRLIRELDAGAGCRVLEAGCGTGRNLSRIADLHPHAHLHGFDISSEMLISARSTFSRTGKAVPDIRVADATTFTAGTFGASGFDRIVLSYALSMIPDWQAAVDRAIEALAPGGSLHVVDFGQQERLPAPFRTLLHTWLARFQVTPRADLISYLKEAAGLRGATVASQPIARGYAWYAVLSLPTQKAAP